MIIKDILIATISAIIGTTFGMVYSNETHHNGFGGISLIVFNLIISHDLYYSKSPKENKFWFIPFTGTFIGVGMFLSTLC